MSFSDESASGPGSADDYDDEVVTFYRKYMGTVRGYLINMGTPHSLVDEIVDDAFLAARRRWVHVRALDRPESYVFKVARNERNRRHKRGYWREEPTPAPELRLPGPWEVIDEPSCTVLDRIVLRRALKRLPPRLREVMILRYIEDLSVAQTAEVMGISAGAVKRYTFEGVKALQGLRTLLVADPEGRTDEAG